MGSTRAVANEQISITSARATSDQYTGVVSACRSATAPTRSRSARSRAPQHEIAMTTMTSIVGVTEAEVERAEDVDAVLVGVVVVAGSSPVVGTAGAGERNGRMVTKGLSRQLCALR